MTNSEPDEIVEGKPSPNQLTPKSFNVANDVHNAWDIIFKFVGALAACAVFVYGIYSYKRTNQDNYKAEFWKKQLEVYTDLTDSAGILASSDDPQRMALAATTFWQIFNGKARLFIESNVDKQMVRFGGALRSYEQSENSDQTELVYYSLELALACRDSLSRAWEVELGPLTPKSSR